MENWLLNMDLRGIALTLPILRDMANLLLSIKKNILSTTSIN
jgi:hypothetical protein